jgi:hypothetical protein
MELLLTAVKMRCDRITADDANNPLTKFDAVDYYVMAREGAAFRNLNIGTLGEWRSGDERTLHEIIWEGSVTPGEHLRLRLKDNDLLLDDLLGEVEFVLHPDGSIAWSPMVEATVEGTAEDGSQEIRLTGSGAGYSLWIKAAVLS